METINYEINKNTCALKSKNEKEFTIIQTDREIDVKMPLNTYLKYNCEYYGSSFNGRRKSSKLMLGTKYKLPIIIEESKEIIFFPTKSYRDKDCSWISLNNINKYEQEAFSTVVTFTSGKKQKFEISIESFENQMFRASKLLLNLKQIKEKL